MDAAKNKRGFYTDIEYYRIFAAATQALNELRLLPCHEFCELTNIENISVIESACEENVSVKS